MNNYSADFDFDADLITLDTIADYFSKIIYLTNKIFDFKIYRLSHPDVIDYKYLKSLKLVRKKLNSTSKLEEKRLKSITKHEHLVSLNESHPVKFRPGFPDIILTEESITAFVSQCIDNIDERKWKYVFLSESDRNIFFKSMSEFFITGKCSLPDMTLQIHSKTRLCAVLNLIYRHYKDAPLNENSSYIKLLKKLSIFESNSNYQIYKTIQRYCG